jgi:hypothetical protein
VEQEPEAMAFFEQEAHSFVMRLWQEQHGATYGWRGWIEHVQSGKRHYFQDHQALQSIFNTYLEQIPDLQTLFQNMERKSF